MYGVFLAAEAASHGATIACDQTPRNLYYLGEILELFGTARAVIMVRDPRDVLLSQKNRWKRRQLSAVDRRTTRRNAVRAWSGYNPTTISLLWRSGARLAERFAQDPRVVVVRFEDLLEDPEGQTRRICSGLDLEFDPAMLDVPRVGSSHQADQPDVRGIDRNASGRWKSGLTPTEVWICQRINRDDDGGERLRARSAATVGARSRRRGGHVGDEVGPRGGPQRGPRPQHGRSGPAPARAMTNSLPDVVIAGVNKAGTTSLYSYLTGHPNVCGSSVKETCFFLPIRYGREPESLDTYRGYFAACRPGQLAVEATPGYFYGGAALARAIDRSVPGVRVVIVLREPVARLISFFRFQQSMLHLPGDLGLAEYVAACDAHDESELLHDQSLNPWFGVLGGFYDRWLPAWTDTFGDRLRIMFADGLGADAVAAMVSLAEWLALDPAPFTAATLRRENATTGFRNRGLQQAALSVNARLETFWRRHPALKGSLRSLYQRVNAGAAADGPDEALRAQLEARYRSSLQQTGAQLRAVGIDDLPAWLT